MRKDCPKASWRKRSALKGEKKNDFRTRDTPQELLREIGNDGKWKKNQEEGA